jgi:hypothetical protein
VFIKTRTRGTGDGIAIFRLALLLPLLVLAWLGCGKRSARTDGGDISCSVVSASDSVAAIAPWPADAAVPKTFEESLVALDRHLTQEQKAYLRCEIVGDSAANAHFWLGLWIRNSWGLHAHSDLSTSLALLGFVHPDDMSSAIVLSYARRLRSEDADVTAQAEAYRRYWIEDGLDADALRERKSR